MSSGTSKISSSIFYFFALRTRNNASDTHGPGALPLQLDGGGVFLAGPLFPGVPIVLIGTLDVLTRLPLPVPLPPDCGRGGIGPLPKYPDVTDLPVRVRSPEGPNVSP